MALTTAYGFLLAVALTAMLLQLTVSKKRVVHIAFAIFCGSIAMMSAQVLSADALGKYSILFGLGSCATCNGYWLVARALFRKHNPIGLQHLAYAGILAVLVVSYRSIGIAEQFWVSNLSALSTVTAVLGEVIGLLSSSVILLTIWEGVRGWALSTHREKKERVLFLSVQGTAVLSTVIIATALSSATGSNIKVWFIPFAASSIIIMTQILLFWRSFESRKHQKIVKPVGIATDLVDETQLVEMHHEKNNALAEQLDMLLIKQQLFLQTNLKVADIARILEVSEYRVSGALKHHFKAENFNRFVNHLRVQYAKQLLMDKDKAHWPVLVIGLESGFASVGPFTRAFKEITGCTPGIFRKQQLHAAA